MTRDASIPDWPSHETISRSPIMIGDQLIIASLSVTYLSCKHFKLRFKKNQAHINTSPHVKVDLKSSIRLIFIRMTKSAHVLAAGVTLLHLLLYCLADLCAYAAVNVAVLRYSQAFSKGLSSEMFEFVFSTEVHPSMSAGTQINAVHTQSYWLCTGFTPLPSPSPSPIFNPQPFACNFIAKLIPGC